MTKSTRSAAVAENADRMVCWDADDDDSKHGNFGGSHVHSMFLIYMPDGTNTYGSRTMEFEGSGSVYEAVVKLCS